MGNQDQPRQGEPPLKTQLWFPAPEQPGKGHCQRGQNEQRMAESTVLGEIGHCGAVIDDDIQIREGAQNCACQQNRAAKSLAGYGAGQGGAQGGLGE